MTMPELIASLNKRIIKDGKRLIELEAENELLRSDLEAEARDADSAVDSVVAKVKWYHAELEEKDATIKALRHLLAWPERTQKAAERSET